MSDTWTADIPEPVDPTPEDTGGKVSQQQANYRDGNLIYHCGLCQHFEGAANGTCTRVAGSINPYMLSDEYDGVKNPLLHKTPPAFRPRARADKPNASNRPSQPSRVRIGRKVY